MRRIAYIGGLFIIFCALALLSKSAYAACIPGVQTPGGGAVVCPVAGKVACSGNGINFTAQCCDSVNECPKGTLPQGSSQIAQVCDFAGAKKGQCTSCMGNGQSVWTAIGCIPTSPTGFIAKFLTLGIGIAGGVAFLLILFGGFQILTSAGNPEQLAAGQELIGSAIAGLLMIIFSIFMLKFVGVDILGIPGFG